MLRDRVICFSYSHVYGEYAGVEDDAHTAVIWHPSPDSYDLTLHEDTRPWTSYTMRGGHEEVHDHAHVHSALRTAWYGDATR